MCSLVPRLPPFFVLWFAFSIIHGSRRALPCIILNTNRSTKKLGRPGNKAIECVGLQVTMPLATNDGSVVIMILSCD